jgi:hypothetical protein
VRHGSLLIQKGIKNFDQRELNDTLHHLKIDSPKVHKIMKDLAYAKDNLQVINLLKNFFKYFRLLQIKLLENV